MSAPTPSRYAELYELAGARRLDQLPPAVQDRVRLAHADGRAPGMDMLALVHRQGEVPTGHSIYCGVLKGEQHASWFIARSYAG